MKRIHKITAITTLLLWVTTISNPLPVFAEPNDLTLEQAIQNIQEYDSEIESDMDKLNTLKEQILEKENDIKENQSKLEAAQIHVNEMEDQLSTRLNVIQINGGFEATPLQYLDALFTSGDILDALKKLSLITQICTSDKNLILEAKKSRSQLLDIKSDIEKEKEELQKNEDDLDKQIKDLENNKNDLLKYIQENNLLLNGDEGITVPVTLPSDISDIAKSIIEESEKYLKVPYLWGGESPEGFDCSGLIQYVFKAKGIDVPRTSQEQQNFAKPISVTEIKPGDLVFNKISDSTHVGMYIGYDMYIQAPHTGDIVKISKLSTSNMKYAGRVLD